ncbi:MAG: hypothetical protein BIFFINMI_03076 [Phycisphaerae bacterium]|nr:hypothetical protein [Phycisphaerae bacterium]
MPTYEYKCDACGHEFELFQSIKANPVRKCPRCGKLKVKRLISAGGGLIFKGSGFYITDYRSDGYKQAAGKDKAPAASDASAKDSSPAKDNSPAKSETKTDSKPKGKSKAKAAE